MGPCNKYIWSGFFRLFFSLLAQRKEPKERAHFSRCYHSPCGRIIPFHSRRNQAYSCLIWIRPPFTTLWKMSSRKVDLSFACWLPFSIFIGSYFFHTLKMSIINKMHGLFIKNIKALDCDGLSRWAKKSIEFFLGNTFFWVWNA